MYRVFILIAILTLGVSLTVFPQATPPKPPAAAPEEPPPVLSVPKDYHYNPRGRRDPFVNPVPKPKVEVAVVAPPSARPPGLKGVLVVEVEIAGVVVSKEPSMNLVTIAAPGGKRYFAHVGDPLFDAVVKSIKLDAVTFALTAPGGGEKTVLVRPVPGENK